MTDPHPYEWAVATAPIGVWQTAEGTFSNVMGAVLTLHADGTGTVLHYGAFGGEDTFDLLWELVAPGELRIYETHEDHPVPETETDWDRFCYRADWRESDAGSGPILVNEGVEDGWLKANGFWRFDGPIRLASRPA